VTLPEGLARSGLAVNGDDTSVAPRTCPEWIAVLRAMSTAENRLDCRSSHTLQEPMSDIWGKSKLPHVHPGSGEYPWQASMFIPKATQVPARRTPLLTSEVIAPE
jgi:hypothetical protein